MLGIFSMLSDANYASLQLFAVLFAALNEGTELRDLFSHLPLKAF